MAKFIVVLKGLGSISLGGGISYGGFELYQHLYPKTLREILEKEGVQLLATENNDDEWEKVWNAYTPTGMSDFKTLKQWCEIELKKTNNKNSKQQITEYCSLEGIKSVAQIISYSEKEKITDNEMTDEDYQLVFLIYTSEFAKIEENKGKLGLSEWLQKNGETQENLETTKKGGNALKRQCAKIKDELEKQKNNEEYESIYWWCTKIKNKGFFEADTIDKRIKYVDKEWKLADDWDKVNQTWEKMAFNPEKEGQEGRGLIEVIEEFVGTDAGTKLIQLTQEGKDKFKSFCEKAEIKNKKLIEDKEKYDSQKSLYRLYKAVCKKT